MNIEKYFEREYNFLQAAGEEFSRKHPTLGSRLHMSERERKDPFVERLFEGFAFLAGRIHERLDDEFPEIAGGILDILFPHMLKPFPSCSILQTKHKPGAITGPVTIPKGSEVQTQTGKYKVKYKVHAGPLEKSRVTEKEEPAEFIFRTTQDLTVRPVRLDEVRIEETPRGTSAIVFKVIPDRNIDYNSLKMNNFQIYLHGAASIKYNLHLFFIKYLSSISVRELNSPAGPFQVIEDAAVIVPELSEISEYEESADHSLLPYVKRTFSGYRLLQEYFSFPDKFFFLEFKGLEKFKASGTPVPFEIKVEFQSRIPRDKIPSINNFYLHCTPIINLFSRSTEEVIVDQRLPEYYIVPDLDRRKSREIYSVDKVTGISKDKFQQYKYIPITSHDILETSDPEYNYKRFYSVFRRVIPGDMNETFIRLFGPSMEQDSFPMETLSIESTLSNGFLPSAYLEVGSIKEPVNFPSGIEASNLTLPSEVLESPERQNYLWSLIAHLTISYTSISDTESLKKLLSLYNWVKSVNHPNKKRIEGIKKIYPTKLTSKAVNGALVRGLEFHIELDANEYENGEGEINLLGMILNKFLSQYITLNSFLFLKISEITTGKEYTWEPKLGKILPV